MIEVDPTDGESFVRLLSFVPSGFARTEREEVTLCLSVVAVIMLEPTGGLEESPCV